MKKGIGVRVPNWAHYAGRSDVKTHVWFKCSNRILEDEDFFDFTDSEILCWIYILSLCSQKKSDTVFINFERAKRFARREREDLLSAIKKLEELEIVEVRVRNPNASRTDPVQNPCARGEESTGEEIGERGQAAHANQPPSPPKKKGKVVYETAAEFRASLPIDTVTKGCAEFTESRFEEMVEKCFEYHNLDEQKVPRTEGEWRKRWFNWCEIERGKMASTKGKDSDEPLKVVPSV